MQKTSYRIWTQVAGSTSYNNSYYMTSSLTFKQKSKGLEFTFSLERINMQKIRKLKNFISISHIFVSICEDDELLIHWRQYENFYENTIILDNSTRWQIAEGQSFLQLLNNRHKKNMLKKYNSIIGTIRQELINLTKWDIIIFFIFIDWQFKSCWYEQSKNEQSFFKKIWQNIEIEEGSRIKQLFYIRAQLGPIIRTLCIEGSYLLRLCKWEWK